MRRRIRRFLIRLLIVLLILAAAFVYLRGRYRDVVADLAETRVKNVTSDLANAAIYKQIEDGKIQYDRLVYFEKDLNGRITALKTNIGEVNKMKTDVLSIINDEIMELDSSDIGIPLGSLIFPELLSGRGPSIPVRVLAIRNSDATFESHFSQAGINQTLHQLIMEVTVSASILVLGETNTFTINSAMVVAETVIVGEVPETYLQSGSFPQTSQKAAP